MATNDTENNVVKPTNFIQQIVDRDLAANKNDGQVQTRFPPEPNGYLHIGHAKSICLNFGLAERNGGACNLRFDDTNPEKEEQEYIESIKQDVEWLGFQWQGEARFASSYFDQFYQYAIDLIKAGKAYVCSLSADDARAYRGTLTEPGRNSPYRERSIEENLALFEQMKQGEFDEGAHVLRAKIDMASPNMNLRDPIIYRIRKVEHHQTGDKWCIYPMYDFAHGISDAIEGITHSICTLEFEDHRPLYDWFLDYLDVPCHPQQIEFARLNLNYTVTSKRKLKQLVDEQIVDGWDDPRMPTIAGMRRRGYTPTAVRNFCDAIGVTRSDGVVDVAMLEHALRDDLNQHAPRAMAVLRPLKVVIENYPEGQVEMLKAPVHPQDESRGTRELPFAREIYIDQEDFKEQANKKFKRLVLGKEVRLRNAYVVRCDEVIKDEAGDIVELRCSYDAETLGKDPEGRKVKGVIHWVTVEHSIPAEVRLYDRLFNDPNPDGHKEADFKDFLNPESLTVLENCRLEPGLATASPQQAYQFEREGYFCLDSKAAKSGQRVFNRTVTLRDSWAKIEKSSES
ncbi:glutamine--tRNA ligase/YqeY domain fusion protein [Endozoicomonas sp. SM1973]|uniref:Glutamine--tRNA ligase n=1 Tax=Spartinivicinus marinus TaxID=2994442 RepID=A0A853I1N9_9GAMM|nr:glutamine--tRNA ligase/YqeY domain fusion protein [Spartinivicinus marinus]MCX4024818.1 glutamine--tRNA ligase/YqeY domain fusion protein [Spartinivicinus marinus]NYZ66539.1 glutamine--tRNA ligase/YqeY domain fusion protein [Spartinivicinus marinus]